VIIVVCTDDDKLRKYAEEAAARNPEIFGQCYRVFQDRIPPLANDENLFISAHGVYEGDDNNPVIGDKKKALFLNGVQAVQQLDDVFPAGDYSGNVYISACEATDHADDDLSFAEAFKSQLHGPRRGTRRHTGKVYGQAGSVGLRVPPPTDAGWQEV
jgi:hypothetical protein